MHRDNYGGVANGKQHAGSEIQGRYADESTAGDGEIGLGASQGNVLVVRHGNRNREVSFT